MLMFPIKLMEEILVLSPRSIINNKSYVVSSIFLIFVSTCAKLYPSEEYKLLIKSASLARLELINDLFSFELIAFIIL